MMGVEEDRAHRKMSRPTGETAAEIRIGWNAISDPLTPGAYFTGVKGPGSGHANTRDTGSEVVLEKLR